METQDTTSSAYRIRMGLIRLTAPPPTPTIALSDTLLNASGTTNAFPYTTATLTDWVGDLYWFCFKYTGAGFPNDDLIDDGVIINPDLPVVGSTAFTLVGSQFYFFCTNISGTVYGLSKLSPPNEGEKYPT